MADPLSVSASVAGLLSLASAVTQSCYGMYREVKNAPRTLKDVIEELGLLRQVLKDLKEIYEQRSEPLAPLETVLTEIHDCGKKLEEFERKLGSKFRNPRKLLSRFRWSFEGGEIKAFVSQLQSCRGIFESAKTNATLKLAMAIRTDVRSESLLQDIGRRESRLKSILEWLSPLEFSERQHDFYDTRREPGTSEWIANEKTFLEWRDYELLYSNDHKRTLWCHGYPGSGKTIACSVLINHLLQLPGDVAVGFIYCFGQDQGAQTCEALVGSLIKQMVRRKISEARVPSVVDDLYQKIGNDGKPSLGALIELLRSVTELFLQAFIVVDGPDELEKNTFTKLHSSALKLIPQNKTKFLISSRPSVPNISRYLRNGFKISVSARVGDVREFLTRQISRNESLRELMGRAPLFIEDMISKICEQCQGQFALAYLQLRRISEETSRAAITAQLKHPAESLTEEYEKSLARMKTLPSPQYQLALRVLNYMTHAKLLLNPEELQDALSTEPGDFTRNVERQPPLGIMLAVCLGFVIENHISGKIEFFHATVPEFLAAHGSVWQDLKLDFGGCCMTYLMSEAFKHPCSEQNQAIERRRQHPFAAYASRFWADSVRGELETKYQNLLLDFLTSNSRISGLQLLPPGLAYDTDLMGEPGEWYHGIGSCNSFAIYSCAYLRLKTIMSLLLKKGLQSSFVAPLGQQFSPLHIAVKQRDLDMCRSLIQAGAEVNLQDKLGRTPLHLCWEHANWNSTWKISPLLAGAGARFDIEDVHGQTVLQYALQHASPSWIPEILNTGLEVGIQHQDLDGNTALHYAVMRRYKILVCLLLRRSANPALKNKKGQSALNLAMESCDSESERIVEEMILHIDKPGFHYGLLIGEKSAAETYLASCAQRRASKDEARTKNEAQECTVRNRFGKGKLKAITWQAEQEDPYELSGLILDGEEINAIDPASGMTPLHHAALAGHDLPTWHLLAAGAMPDIKDSRNALTPPELALREGHMDIASLFHCDDSSSQVPSGEGFVWQSKSYQVGRGMWSKYISGKELERAYQNASQLRRYIIQSSIWMGPGMEIWYDYLGYKPTNASWRYNSEDEPESC